jgi:hypothetical protein
MAWSYRVLLNGHQLAIHEVFYSKDGKIIGATEKPVYPRAETIEDLAAELTRYGAALQAPVLAYHEIADATEQIEAQADPSKRREGVFRSVWRVGTARHGLSDQRAGTDILQSHRFSNCSWQSCPHAKKHLEDRKRIAAISNC